MLFEPYRSNLEHANIHLTKLKCKQLEYLSRHFKEIATDC